ncbi:MAG: ABC transporter permease [Candidatus Bathyarchaeia archaeon]
MVSGLRNLVVKEIKEMIRDPKILLGMVLMPLIMFPVMGAAMNISQTAVEESLREVSMALMDLDQGPMAKNLIQSFDALKVTLMEMEASSLDEALELLQGSNITNLVVIPSGFSRNLTLGFRGELEIYSVIKSISLSEGAKASVANAPIGAYENLLVYQAIKQAIPDRSPETVLDPIALHSFVIFKGRLVEAPPGVLTGLFMSQSFAFPMVIMLLLISAMQMAATSVAIEKEEKTLETLLTLPVGRLSILAGKLGGSVVVAAAGAIAALIGVNYYTSSIFRSVPMESLDMEALGFALSPTAYVLLGVTMFVTIISALALAICLSVFSENVRSAQAVVSFMIIPVVVPSLILMFADIEILPFAVQAIMYILPYTHSIIASKAAFMGDYFIMLRSIAYISLFTIVILYIAAKIFTTEKIVTARISFKKLGIKRFLAR